MPDEPPSRASRIQHCGTLPGLTQLDMAGITVAEVGTLGLNSGDLRDLGVEVSIMSQHKKSESNY